MAIDTNATVADFLQAAADKRPDPGGGAVAALVGALAASMGAMTLRYTKDLSVAEPLAELERARELFEQLIVEDQEAYANLVAVRKAGGDVQTAALTAIAVPQAIATTAVSVLNLAEKVVPVANKWLLSDLAVCCELAMATVRCGLYNIRANLPEADEATIARVSADCVKLLDHAAAAINRAIPAIRRRQEEAD